MTAHTFRQIVVDYAKRVNRLAQERVREKALPTTDGRLKFLAEIDAEIDRCNLILSELRVEIQRSERTAPTLFNEVDALRR